MLHLVEQPCPVQESDVLRRMFAARKQVFVDLLQWDIPVLDGQYEIDQFDDEHAAYLVVADPGGRHLASARLLPTTRPHILADLYDRLCEAEVPRGPDVYEVTRFCLDRNIDADLRRGARDRLVWEIAEYGLAHGIRLYTGVAEAAWLQQILTFGWHAYPLGLPQKIGGKMLGALAIEIDENTPERLAAAGICAAPADTEPRHAV